MIQVRHCLVRSTQRPVWSGVADGFGPRAEVSECGKQSFESGRLGQPVPDVSQVRLPACRARKGIRHCLDHHSFALAHHAAHIFCLLRSRLGRNKPRERVIPVLRPRVIFNTIWLRQTKERVWCSTRSFSTSLNTYLPEFRYQLLGLFHGDGFNQRERCVSGDR